MSGSQDALAYEEPAITTILIQSCFLLALNIVNSVLDKLIFCGLIGQLLIGMAWGIPGANWLSLDFQHVIQQLGYIGLILLVYEGGLSTSFSQLKANFVLSALVALTGVGVPMGLSFTLCNIVSATPLQAFAAGASLCSTSIGTTFTILSTTGLAKKRLGVVLGGAAMMDDVAGLVMVQIISNLGGAGSGSSFKPVIVIRPIFVAIGFALGLVLVCRFVVASVLRKLHTSNIPLPPIIKSMQFAFVAHMCLLIGMVAGASYAGTSPLFAAYLSGACISWFDEMIGGFDSALEVNYSSNSSTTRQPPRTEIQSQRTENEGDSQSGSGGANPSRLHSREEPGQNTGPILTGEHVFERFCKQSLDRILKPLFFASIGFSIPITQMFHKQIVWRGIVYSLLMAFGKVITSVWLIRISISPGSVLEKIRSNPLPAFCALRPRNEKKQKQKRKTTQQREDISSRTQRKRRTQNDDKPRVGQNRQSSTQANTDPMPDQTQKTAVTRPVGQPSDDPIPSHCEHPRVPTKPRSLYPASILGLAMVARGEIGFLIASLAETDGIFAHKDSSSSSNDVGGSSEMYLVVLWAITLCTFVGPICVGALVRRVQTLQAQRIHSGREDPLGVWGV